MEGIEANQKVSSVVSHSFLFQLKLLIYNKFAYRKSILESTVKTNF